MPPKPSGAIIANAKEQVVRAIDHQRTLMYLEIGKRIFEEEQEGKDWADYGKYLTQFIAQEIEPEFGSGFSKRKIELFRQRLLMRLSTDPYIRVSKRANVKIHLIFHLLKL